MYATSQDLSDRLGEPRLVQLTDIGEVQTGEVGAVVVDRALQDASAEIDGYLVGRYPLPLPAPPAILKVHCCAIALYRLAGSAASEVEREDYKAAIVFLQRVAEGRVSLVAPVDAPPVAGVGSVTFETGAKEDWAGQ